MLEKCINKNKITHVYFMSLISHIDLQSNDHYNIHFVKIVQLDFPFHFQNKLTQLALSLLLKNNLCSIDCHYFCSFYKINDIICSIMFYQTVFFDYRVTKEWKRLPKLCLTLCDKRKRRQKIIAVYVSPFSL